MAGIKTTRKDMYRELKSSIDSKKYNPTENYASKIWRNLKTSEISDEYKRYQDFKATEEKEIVENEVNRLNDFVDSEAKSFEVNLNVREDFKNKMIERMFLIAGQSRDKFYSKARYTIVSTGETRTKMTPIARGREVKTAEEIKEYEEYDYLPSDLNIVESLEILRLDKPSIKKLEGAFFRYYNKYPEYIDLERYQIYGSKPENYDTNCLIHAFKTWGLEEKKLKELQIFNKSQNVPKCALKNISKFLDINIEIKIRKKDDSDWKKEKIKAKSDKTINLCLLEDHYFLEEPTRYTPYSIENFQKLKNKRDWHRFRNKDARAKEGERMMLSSKLIYLMLKNDMFKPIELAELAKTQFLGNYKQEEPEAICSGDYKTEKYEARYTTLTKKYSRNKKGGVTLQSTVESDFKNKKVKTVNRHYVFADTETCTKNRRHVPYMCSYTTTIDVNKELKEVESNCLTGEDCITKFLDKMPPDSVIYFHNLGYDIAFIYEYTRSVNLIKSGGMVYLYICMYKGKRLEFRDSYAMIPDKLANFSSMFALGDIKKEIMPYSLYKMKDYSEPCDIDQALKHVKQSDHKAFLELSKNYMIEHKDAKGLKDGKLLFDKLEYAKFYCNRDVEVLINGMTKFRLNMILEFDIDPLAYLTISSVANAYLMKCGCFEGVYKLSGCRREFIQQTVKGGRCMTRRNQSFEVKDKLNDFDGVSLYPSAMYLFDGFVKGKPKKIRKFEPEKYSHYFVKIKITKINKILDFPLISVKDDEGILQYLNELTTMYVDKYALEDLIKFQGIEYEFIEGFYFDEGYNDKIKSTIKHMFEQRLHYKKERNPVQIIYKLLMNSSYGKTIMKEHLTDDVIINKDQYNDYMYRHHNYIKEVVKVGDQYWVKKTKSINNHFSYPQVGSAILSYSKRIMNRVFGVAHDNDIPIYYQDTDSMHIKDEDVSRLAKAYDAEYNTTLIGKGLGQFHCDFDLPGAKDPVSVNSIFLGKKTYIDILEGNYKDGKIINGIHCRFKGIPNECVLAVAKESYNNSPYQLYKDMMGGKKITFDLCKGIDRVRPVFENKHGVIKSLTTFKREVSFKPK